LFLPAFHNAINFQIVSQIEKMIIVGRNLG